MHISLFKKIQTMLLVILCLLNIFTVKAEENSNETVLDEEKTDEVLETVDIEEQKDNEEITDFVEDNRDDDLSGQEHIFPEIEESISDVAYEETFPAFDQEVVLDDVIISVSADVGAFPADCFLYAEKVESKFIEHIVDNAREEDSKVALSYTYDIKIFDKEGQEVQPIGDVSVKFTLREKVQQVLDVSVYHIDEDYSAETMEEVAVSDLSSMEEFNTEVEVLTDSFSYYTVEFTYKEITYVLEGDSSVELSYALEQCGISGNIESAIVSNDQLFSVYKENNIWL